MKTPSSWSKLVAAEQSHRVPAYRKLRQQAGTDTFQYIVGDQELLAIPGTRPYGDLTDITADHPAAGNLLQVVERGEDFAVFDVPIDTLSLRALILGSGRRNVESLRVVCRQVGMAIGALVRDVPVPLLSIEDMAFHRQAGKPLFLPPVVFGEGTQTLSDHDAALAASITEDFGPIWPSEAILELTNGVTEGMSYDSSTS